jgi:hypothetical protein
MLMECATQQGMEAAGSSPASVPYKVQPEINRLKQKQKIFAQLSSCTADNAYSQGVAVGVIPLLGNYEVFVAAVHGVGLHDTPPVIGTQK